MVYSYALGDFEFIDQSSYVATPSEVAIVTLRQIEGTRLRLRVVKAALASALPTVDLERFDRLCKLVGKRSRERNAVVHARWYCVDDFPIDVVTELHDRTFVRYTPSCFDAIVDRTEDAIRELLLFQTACFDAAQAKHLAAG